MTSLSSSGQKMMQGNPVSRDEYRRKIQQEDVMEEK